MKRFEKYINYYYPNLKFNALTETECIELVHQFEEAYEAFISEPELPYDTAYIFSL